jgi:hypothetical protein
MIRIVAVEDTLDQEGGCTLIITGHGDDRSCARASALWYTMLAGYKLMAESYPRQVSFQKIEKKKTIRK